MIFIRLSRTGLLLSVCLILSAMAGADEITPLGFGPYPVASTNMEVAEHYSDLTDDEIEHFLTGKKELFGDPRYVSELMRFPQAAWITEVAVPDTPALYGPASGDAISTLAFVTFPSAKMVHPKPYEFPYHKSAYGKFEHMLGPDDFPVFPDDKMKYPLVILAHGATAHGIYDIGHANKLASHGYVVAVIFYGDNRTMSLVGSNDHLSFLRPLLTKAVIDSLASSAQFGAHIDFDNVGVSGHSFGGFTALAMAGAPTLGDSRSVTDDRVKAAVVAAPWTGGRNLKGDYYAFGDENNGLAKVTIPTMCLYGTDDSVTIAESILPAMKKVRGPLYVVELVDQPHIFEGGSWQDRDNWELLFFNAYLKNDVAALNAIRRGTSMAGGNVDRQRFDYQVLPGSALN